MVHNLKLYEKSNFTWNNLPKINLFSSTNFRDRALSTPVLFQHSTLAKIYRPQIKVNLRLSINQNPVQNMTFDPNKSSLRYED